MLQSPRRDAGLSVIFVLQSGKLEIKASHSELPTQCRQRCVPRSKQWAELWFGSALDELLYRTNGLVTPGKGFFKTNQQVSELRCYSNKTL